MISPDQSTQESSGAVARDFMLMPGSRIDFYSGPGELAERLQLSSGTRRASADPDLAGLYWKGAFVPRTPWREASTAELARLSFECSAGGPKWRPGADIAVIRIPDDVMLRFSSILEQCGVRETAGKEAAALIAQHSRWSETVSMLSRHLETMSQEPFNQIYVRVAQPRQLTLTKDEFGKEVNRNKYAGLHADHWDGLPLRHRSRSRNRVCVNLGREPRYALFFNLPMMDMFRSIGLREPEDIYTDFRGLVLGQRFMKAWPGYPLVRLRLDPGEAYILPTDNLVHDASTEGNQYPDISLSYLGFFTPRGLISQEVPAAVF